jgi:hypothetical protein
MISIFQAIDAPPVLPNITYWPVNTGLREVSNFAVRFGGFDPFSACPEWLVRAPE